MSKLVKMLCLLLLAIMVCAAFFVNWRKDRAKTKAWLQRNEYKMGSALIALLSTAYMFKHAAAQSLWIDELWQISFALAPLEQVLKWICTSNHGLFHFFSFLWYKIAPYGEQWLVLPSVIATGAGVYITALCGFRLKNGYTGLLAAMLVGFSKVVMEQCGMEFRMYGFVFFFSALLLYLFLGHIQAGKSERPDAVVVRFLVMAALSLNHLFGFLFCCSLFVVDLGFYFFRRVKCGSLIIYPALILAYLPVLINTYMDSVTGWDTHSWMAVPGWSAVYKLFKFLVGDMQWGYVLFIVSLVWLCSDFLRGMLKERRVQEEKVVALIPLFVMVIVIAFEFCFGNLAGILHLNGTLWVDRYFSCLIPCAALLCALAMTGILKFFEQKSGVSFFIEAFVILFFCLAPYQMLTVYNDVTKLYEPYREAAKWLYEQEDIFNDDVVVVTTSIEDVTIGWTDYYLTQQGQRSCFKLLTQQEIKERPSLLKGCQIVYLQSTHFDVEEELQALLDRDFKLVGEKKDFDITVYHAILDN